MILVRFAAAWLLVAGSAIAGDDQPPGAQLSSWLGAAWVLAPVVLGFVLRRRPVGGWLLVYLWECTLRAVVALSAGIWNAVHQLTPNHWADHRVLAAYLAAEFPGLILAAVEATVALLGSRPRSRSHGVLLLLRGILWLEILACAVAAGLDALYWNENLVMSAVSMAWPVIWLGYFYTSRRAKRVYAGPPDVVGVVTGPV